MTTAHDHRPHVWDLLRADAPEARAGDTIRVDDAGLIFRGDYVRDGADLVVTGSGQRLVVHDYFTAAHRPKLVAPNGASLSDAVIEALARPLHGVQVAQAGQPPVSDATQAIGRVQSLTGTASVVRNGVTVAIHTGDLVYKGDVLQTDRASGLAVSFLDGTLFSLAASARMVMTEMVYQAGGTGNHSLFNIVQGSISFVAGQVAKTGDMKVGTPVATMGIRGTAVQATVQADDGTSRLSVMTEPPSPEYPQGHTGRFDVYDRDDPNDLLFTVFDPNVVAVVHPKGTGDVRVDQVPKTPADIAYENTLVRTLYQGQADAPRLPVYNGPPTGGGTSSGTPPNQILPNQAPAQPPPGAPGTQGPAPAAPGSGTPEGVQGPAHQPDPPPPPSGDAPRTDVVPNAAPGTNAAAPPAPAGPAVEPPPVVQAPPVPTPPVPAVPQPVPADPPPASPQPAAVEVVPPSQAAAVEAASPVPSVAPAPAAPVPAAAVPAAAALVLASLAATVAEGGVLTADAAHGLLAGDGAGVTVVGAHAGSGPDVGLGGGSVTLVGQYGTLTLLADGTYVYIADHAASLAQGQQAADVFGFSARSGGGATASATLTIAVTGTNDPPTSGGSHAIGVIAGGATVVGAAALAGSDPDDSSNQLTYTITSHPHGTFTDAGGNATTTFTQAEIDAGTIVYHHDGTATGGGASDVAFILTDAAGASVSGILAVAVTPPGGRVVDGYIAGALIFADANGNGVLDSGEVSTYSSADGSFTLFGGSGRLVATGGTDISTGLPNVLTLTSPAGSAIIDPLTTLVQGLGGTAAANAQVAAAFGLPSGTDLTALDPVAAAASGSATGRSAYLANVAVADTTALLSAALIGYGVDPAAAYAAILGQIAGLVGSLGPGATLDLTGAATGQSLLAGAAAALQVSLTAQAVAAVAGAAGASNTQLYGPPAANQSLLDHGAATAAAARAQAASLESLLTPPSFVEHTHPVVAQGGSIVLSGDNLLASDPNDAAGSITYTITDDPHGSFSLRSVVGETVHLSPVVSFTQADVDAGRVVYQHDDTVPAGGIERVSFTLSDAAGGSVAGHLDIAVDARPVITAGGAAATVSAIPIAGNATPQSQVGQDALTAGHSLINTLGGPAGFGTSVLDQGDDNSSGAIDITAVFGAQGLNFFGTYYTSLYVNNNGNITFGGPSSTFTPSQITASSAAIIAPFFADVDTRGGATSPTPGGTSTGSDRVYINADTVGGVFTVTWDDVGYYSGHTQNPNAFQVQLVSLGGGNFDIVYRYEAVNWTVGDASDGVNAVVGYAAGNGVNAYELPQSGDAAQIRALPTTPGNTGIPGVYVFQAFGGTVTPNATLQATGAIGFTDADAGAHTASSTLDHLSLTTARGLTIPSDTAAALQAALTAQVTQDGSAGTVTWSFALANSAAAFLRPGESLTATYAVAVADGIATSAPTTVTVTINGVNDAPNAGGDRAIGVTPGGAAVVHTADLGATDPDNGPGQITYTITGNPHGSFTLSSLQNGIPQQTPVTTFTQADIDAGTITYAHDGTTPAGGFETVTYTLSDGAGGSAGGTLTVAVAAANTAPLLETVAPGGVQAATATRGVTDLTQRQLDAIVAAALSEWAAAGASAAQIALLAAATYAVADLPGGALGQESAGHVTIDADAAGYGWYLDPTPGDNTAFPHAANAAGSDLYTDPSLAAAGHIDLLTTVMHEMGHVLGLPDTTAPADAHDLMSLNLVAGERRLPVAADVAAATAATAAVAPTTAGRHAAATPAAPSPGHAGSSADAAGTSHAGPAPAVAAAPDHTAAAVAPGPDAGTPNPTVAGTDHAGSNTAPTTTGPNASAGADPAQTGPAPVPRAADRTDHLATSPTAQGGVASTVGDHPAAVVDTSAPAAFAASQAVGSGPNASAADPVPAGSVPLLPIADHADHSATGPAPTAQATAASTAGDHPATAQDAGAHASTTAGTTASTASQATGGSGSGAAAGTATTAADHAATSQGPAAQGVTASGADHGATGQAGSTSTTGDGHAATTQAAAGQTAADAGHAATQGTATQGPVTQDTASQGTASSTAQADLAHMATTHDVFVFSQPSAGSSASVQAIHHFTPTSDSLDLSFLPDAAVQTIGDYVHIQASAGGGYDLSVRGGTSASFVTVGHFDAGTLHDGDHVSVSVHDHVAQVVALQLHTS